MDFGYLVVAGALIAAFELLVCFAIGKLKKQGTLSDEADKST